MRLITATDAVAAGNIAATQAASAMRAAIAARGWCVLALSRLQTGSAALQALARTELAWECVQVVQVDERVVVAGDARRNSSHLRIGLVDLGLLPLANLHEMPVDATDLDAAAGDYARLLEKLAGSPPQLDVVHLGLGSDGHTASLLPGDPVLEASDRPVAITHPYDGVRRMTLTFDVLNRARSIVWLVTGRAKSAALGALIARTGAAPAQRVAREQAVVIADAAAAEGIRA